MSLVFEMEIKCMMMMMRFSLGVSLFNRAVCVHCYRHAGVLFGISNTVGTIPGMLAPTVAGLLTPNVRNLVVQIAYHT